MPSPNAQALQLHFRIHTPRPARLDIHALMFPYDRLHQTFVNVYEDGGLRQQFVLSADSADRHVLRGDDAGRDRGDQDVRPGRHPSHPDRTRPHPFSHWPAAARRRWKALLRIVTAFTIGHSITLSLAALNIVTPPPNIIEPAIALSIVFVGADNLVRGGGRDGPRAHRAHLRPGARLRLRERAARSSACARRRWLVALLVQRRRRDRAAVHRAARFATALAAAAAPERARRQPRRLCRLARRRRRRDYWFVQRVFFPAGI